MNSIIERISNFEDQTTSGLFKELKNIKAEGFLTKQQLLLILRWKSPRPLHHYELNDDKSVREITKLAFATKDDKLKIHILTALCGVKYPSASAILMFYDSKKYPVLDIRVWRQLYKHKLVSENAKGQNFTLNQWEDYLKVIRDLGKSLNLTARQTEKRIFDHDRETQEGRLYNSNVHKK